MCVCVVGAMCKFMLMVTVFGLSIIKDRCVSALGALTRLTQGGDDGEVGYAGQGRVKDTFGYPL